MPPIVICRGKYSAGIAHRLRLVLLAMIVGSRDLTVLDQAARILAEAKSLDEIKSIRDKAEAARAYVKAAKLGLELQNRAAEVKLRAERKAGGLLRTLKLRGGDRKSKGQAAALKLRDLDISRDQSKRWQRIASVPEAEFSNYLRDMTDHGREITSAGVLRIAGKGRGTQLARPSHLPLLSPFRVMLRTGRPTRCLRN